MDYRRSTLRHLIESALPEEGARQISAYGWVKTRRDSKGISFVQVNDGSCFKDLQVVIEAGVIPEETLKSITVGSAVRFDGELVESPAAGQPVELKATGVEIFGPADPTSYPLQKKGTSFEFLREIAHLRARGNTLGAVLRVRSETSYRIHKFFQDRHFQLVQTPIISTSDCEGAGQMFQVTTSVELDGEQYKVRQPEPDKDFFGKPAYLTVSGQLEAEALALGLTNVYSFGPTFRAENSETSRHLAEFWMIEPEMAFCDLEGDMNLAEEFLKDLIQHILESCSSEIAFFNQRIEPELLQTLEHVVESPFERLTYTEAIELLQGADKKFEFPVYWGADLQSEHERWLTEEKIGRPVILTDYPKEIKAFYMRLNDDGKTVAAMDVLVPRIGEIIGGSQREERLDVLRDRMKEAGLDESHYWWYLDLRRFGSAPHAGFGLGLERFVMYVTGMKNIRDVIPFYRAVGYAEF
ncbi:MAG: asparagine--tRNA ligase [Fimbriimonadaceae bacterium]